MTHDELIEAERVFINGVWDTLKGDHDDLRKQQIILHLYRAAIRVIAPAVIEEAAKEADKIEIRGRQYLRFIRYPAPVTDGTIRCIQCGQIDEPEYHDDELCLASIEGTGHE